MVANFEYCMNTAWILQYGSKVSKNFHPPMNFPYVIQHKSDNQPYYLIDYHLFRRFVFLSRKSGSNRPPFRYEWNIHRIQLAVAQWINTIEFITNTAQIHKPRFFYLEMWFFVPIFAAYQLGKIRNDIRLTRNLSWPWRIRCSLTWSDSSFYRPKRTNSGQG